MAPWQFKTKVVPRNGILKVHREIPEQLEVIEVSTEFSIEELESRADALPKYWKGEITRGEVESKLGWLLPTRESWSDAAKMFGDSKRDSIEIWGIDDDQIDRVTISFSLSEPNVDFIEAAMIAVQKLECVFLDIQSRNVFEPVLQEFINHAGSSSAARFLPNELTLPEIFAL